MSPKTKKILNPVLWSALIVYLIVASSYCSGQRSDRVCSGLNIVVKDSDKLGLTTPEKVRGVLVSERMKITGVKFDSISLPDVERVLLEKPYIKSVRVYPSMDDKLNVEVWQRAPVVRVQAENGYRFYLSADGYVFPLESSAYIDVPIVSGVPEFSFGTDFAGKAVMPEDQEKKSLENYEFLHKLINFVEFIRQDAFWCGQVVQIHVISGNEIELIPRVGRGVVLLGTLDGYTEKLEKLYKFYRKGLAYEGWDKYGYINLKFKDQVVCTE